MVKSLATSVMLMGLIGACTPEPGCPAPEASIVLIYNGEQPRWTNITQCETLAKYDLAGGTSQLAGEVDIVILDGHSVPPSRVLGRPLGEIEVLIAELRPLTVVGVTCNLAELQTLNRLFHASPRLERVIASPTSLPWAGLSDVAACCGQLDEGRGCSACFGEYQDLVHEFTRAEVERASVLAAEHLDALHDCTVPITLVEHKRHPPYLCLSFDELQSPLIWKVEHGQLRQTCAADRDPPPVSYTACVSGDDPASQSAPS